jgi:hypothetical protein
VPWLTVGGRTWLDDADRLHRRLAVHPHPERGWITLSIWETNECRATFHLRLADAPHFIYQLAEGLAGATDLGPGDASGAGGGGAGGVRPSVVETGMHLLGRGARWLGGLGPRGGLGRAGPASDSGPASSSGPASGAGPASRSGPPRLRAVEDRGSQPGRSSG